MDAAAAADAQTPAVEGVRATAMKHLLLILVVSLFAIGCDDESKLKRRRPGSVSTPVAPVVPSPPKFVLTSVTPEAPKPVKPLPLIRVAGVKSRSPQTTPEKALTDALEAARDEIMHKLRALDPPVYAKPSLAKVRSEYLKKDSIVEEHPTEAVKAEWKANKLDTNRSWVIIDCELTEKQVQRLRANDRVNDGLRGAGLVMVLCIAAYGFLRVDAWTKGYLTIWLAVAATLLVLGTAAIAVMDFLR